MSTSRTARRPTSVAPAIAIATLRFVRFGLGKAAFAFLALTTTYLIKLNLKKNTAKGKGARWTPTRNAAPPKKWGVCVLSSDERD